MSLGQTGQWGTQGKLQRQPQTRETPGLSLRDQLDSRVGQVTEIGRWRGRKRMCGRFKGGEGRSERSLGHVGSDSASTQMSLPLTCIFYPLFLGLSSLPPTPLQPLLFLTWQATCPRGWGGTGGMNCLSFPRCTSGSHALKCLSCVHPVLFFCFLVTQQTPSTFFRPFPPSHSADFPGEVQSSWLNLPAAPHMFTDVLSSRS